MAIFPSMGEIFKKILRNFDEKNTFFQRCTGQRAYPLPTQEAPGGRQNQRGPADSDFSRRAFGVGDPAYPLDALPA